MCWLHPDVIREEYEYLDDEDPPPPVPRSLPQLAWTVPVNVVRLAANLQAYSNLLPAVTSLRLIHRFGDGALSKLPQEVLEMVIDEAQRSERVMTLPQVKKQYACFRGICENKQHYNFLPSWTSERWSSVFVDNYHLGLDLLEIDNDGPLDPKDYTDDQKADMVARAVVEMSDDDAMETIDEIHQDTRTEWVDSLCLCNGTSKMAILNKILKEYFGLETVIFHETLTAPMVRFLPSLNRRESNVRYTSAFLVLGSGTFHAPTNGHVTASHTNPLFMHDDHHLAFRQSVDPTKLLLSDNQCQRFSKAMRILDLTPHFHLTQMESSIASIASPTSDNSLLEICDFQLPGHPEPTFASRRVRAKKLKAYSRQQNQELSKLSWPQLQLLAASDTAGPN
ncbi:hypothetical protein CC80DRAFT_487488 [Byssothecium circinans]|uniref:Uncharacterized protein n=1 Tax=Byssothecium circinans TaxID=147558 RepID=A0A6A5UDT8_9PLEO|nr:hypothetical protein CC80DRAFT_487488 [Byssothecium circinans]